MSLLRLLNAGRSLVNPKESGSRYRMHDKVQLPKFGSSKNPFSARSETPAVPAAPGATLSETSPQQRELSSAELAAAQLKETVRLPALPPSAPLSQAPVAGSSAKWWNPLSWWRTSGGVATRGAGSRPAVQGELSLDQVKVVRNDLSDSDVEIVQPVAEVKGRSERKASEPREAMEEAPRV